MAQRSDQDAVDDQPWPWLRIAAMLALLALLLVGFRSRFAWDRELALMPSLALAGGLVLAGGVFLLVVPLIRRAETLPGERQRRLLGLIAAVGLGLRLIMLWTTPALEDDVYRYLWDGGVLANGFNPYALAPAQARSLDAPERMQELADAAGHVHDRINHPHLRTIYPPVAAAAFALAHLLEPWSLLAWRLVCLGCEIASFGLLLALLQAAGRSPLWVSVYWWNPLVIKELLNSAHMDALVVPLVLAALLAAMRQRHLLSMAALGLACGTKIWPALLLPVLLRPLWPSASRLAGPAVLFAAIAGLCAAPPLLAGLDATSGFVAYATYWKTNSALFPLLERIVGGLGSLVGLGGEAAGRIARLTVATLAGVIAIGVAVRPVTAPIELAERAALVASALVLLSPAQFPWYLVWVMPLLALRPISGLLAATALVPIYYASFHFHAHASYWIFSDWLVWAIWLPVWALLWRQWRGRRTE